MTKVGNMALAVLASLLFGSPISWAEMNPTVDIGSMTVFERARRRAYPGGIDEEKLVVLGRLPSPRQKITHKAMQSQVFAGLYRSKKKQEEDDKLNSESSRSQ